MNDSPVIIDHLTQIFQRHYGYAEAGKAAEAALKFIDILELYQMKVIIGEWTVPEVIVQKPLTGWDKFVATIDEVEESGREPWLAREIQ